VASTVAGDEKTGEDVVFSMWTADLASSPRRELPKDKSRGSTTATGYSGSMMRRGFTQQKFRCGVQGRKGETNYSRTGGFLYNSTWGIFCSKNAHGFW
jgi:hypothetical protein